MEHRSSIFAIDAILSISTVGPFAWYALVASAMETQRRFLALNFLTSFVTNFAREIVQHIKLIFLMNVLIPFWRCERMLLLLKSPNRRVRFSRNFGREGRTQCGNVSNTSVSSFLPEKLPCERIFPFCCNIPSSQCSGRFVRSSPFILISRHPVL